MFLEKEGETRLSVDRLDDAPPGEAVEIEDREEQKRHAQELADASAWRGRPTDI